MVSHENEAQMKNGVEDSDLKVFARIQNQVVRHFDGECPLTPPSKKIQGAYFQICRTEKHGKDLQNPGTVVNSAKPLSGGAFDVRLDQNLKVKDSAVVTNLQSK